MRLKKHRAVVAAGVVLACCLALPACGGDATEQASEAPQKSEEYERILAERVAAEQAEQEVEQEAAIKADEEEAVQEQVDEEALKAEQEAAEKAAEEEAARLAAEQEAANQAANSDALRAELGIAEDYRAGFVHGEKPAEFQKYIVLHDTEGSGDPYSVVSSWDASGNLIAAHFVVGKDGTVVQCVPLDKIAHHAGFGDAGHNAQYGVEDESRDDKAGTTPIGDWAPDYGMNSYSIGIEMVHISGEGYYPEEQLAAVDKLIAYIDAYFGFQSTIIDHKAWRSGNSDTSPEFAGYLANYQDHRTHN